MSLLGISLEYFADNELARFRKRSNQQLGEILETGLWGRMRYPNYLGEMLFWIGLALAGLSVNAPWYSIAGALAMVAMMLGASIPMKEKRMMERRQNYADYQARVPLLFPKLFAKK